MEGNKKRRNIMKKFYTFGISVTLAVSVILMIWINLFLIPTIHSEETFNYKSFPDVSNMTTNSEVYCPTYNIFWTAYDIDGDEISDIATGQVPRSAIKRIIMTKMGPQLVFQIDVMGVPITYYWKDMDKNNTPHIDAEESSNYNNAEILFDPKGDGLNGNERPMHKKPFKTEDVPGERA